MGNVSKGESQALAEIVSALARVEPGQVAIQRLNYDYEVTVNCPTEYTRVLCQRVTSDINNCFDTAHTLWIQFKFGQKELYTYYRRAGETNEAINFNNRTPHNE